MGTRRISTEDHGDFTLFFTVVSPFSNFYRTSFQVQALDGSKHRYSCVEQFYMYNKAILAHDGDAAAKILLCSNPKEMKQIGRNLKTLDVDQWNLVSKEVMRSALKGKFSQDCQLLFALFLTRGSRLVECSPTDKLWGIGLSIDDPDSTNPTRWRGKNQLGSIMDEVRQELWESNDSMHRSTREEVEEKVREFKDYAVLYLSKFNEKTRRTIAGALPAESTRNVMERNRLHDRLRRSASPRMRSDRRRARRSTSRSRSPSPKRLRRRRKESSSSSSSESGRDSNISASNGENSPVRRDSAAADIGDILDKSISLFLEGTLNPEKMLAEQLKKKREIRSKEQHGKAEEIIGEIAQEPSTSTEPDKRNDSRSSNEMAIDEIVGESSCNEQRESITKKLEKELMLEMMDNAAASSSSTTAFNKKSKTGSKRTLRKRESTESKADTETRIMSRTRKDSGGSKRRKGSSSVEHRSRRRESTRYRSRSRSAGRSSRRRHSPRSHRRSTHERSHKRQVSSSRKRSRSTSTRKSPLRKSRSPKRKSSKEKRASRERRPSRVRISSTERRKSPMLKRSSLSPRRDVVECVQESNSPKRLHKDEKNAARVEPSPLRETYDVPLPPSVGSQKLNRERSSEDIEKAERDAEYEKHKKMREERSKRYEDDRNREDRRRDDRNVEDSRYKRKEDRDDDNGLPPLVKSAKKETKTAAKPEMIIMPVGVNKETLLLNRLVKKRKAA